MFENTMIDQFAKDHSLPTFRITQFNLAYYKEFISSYDELTTWPKNLREELKSAIPFSTITPVTVLESKDKGTQKIVFTRISDEKRFESVLMRHDDKRNTVCVSCMVGCPMGCAFCATGKMRFIANLTAREIVDQMLYFARILKKQKQVVTNVVFMGMGEPLLNLEQVMEAIRTLNNPLYMEFGIRRITISTCGITPKIYELMKLGYKGRLALSLHAPNQALRESLMPIAKTYPLPELMSTVKAFATRTQLRVSYEYILINGVNDTPEHAKELVSLIGEDVEFVHINLIPYNPIPGVSYSRSTSRSIHEFADILSEFGISNTFRVTMGDDIKAACGQLANS
ncbi:MAG: 23S rRNA (adenine(2503)-C(2))-methyltransferase RlmN [Candidatus Roizmanbacteria bacterium]|nr:23S rRNA (adenine(2503)-C(2))-methyltransferase RlmN [Candidatus Roizmanbacteria bacterium]